MDELDAMEAALFRKARRRKLVLGLVGLAALLSVILPCGYVVFLVGGGISRSREQRAEYEEEHGHLATDAQRQAVDNALRAAEERLPVLNERWHEVLARSKDAVGNPSIPCAHRLPLRPPREAQRHGSFNNLDNFDVWAFVGRAFPWRVVTGGLPEEAPRVAQAREESVRLRNQIGETSSLESHAQTVESAEFMRNSYWSYDVLIVPDTYHPPLAHGLGESFSPGLLVGRALVYDYQEERVVCSAPIRAATTSEHVDYTAQQFQGVGTLQSMLRAEMDAEIERAVALAMRDGGAVAPPMADALEGDDPVVP